MILPVYRVFDIENRRHRTGNRFAVFHRHAAVVALGHDLQCQTVLAADAHADQSEIHRVQHRFDDRRNTGIETGLGDEPRFVAVCACGQWRFGHLGVRIRFPEMINKKERVPGAHSCSE